MRGTPVPWLASLQVGESCTHNKFSEKITGTACGALTPITVNGYTRSGAIPLKPHVTTCYSSYTAIKPVYIKATNLPETRSLGCRSRSSRSFQQCSSFPDVLLPHVFVFNSFSKQTLFFPHPQPFKLIPTRSATVRVTVE